MLFFRYKTKNRKEYDIYRTGVKSVAVMCICVNLKYEFYINCVNPSTQEDKYFLKNCKRNPTHHFFTELLVLLFSLLKYFGVYFKYGYSKNLQPFYY